MNNEDKSAVQGSDKTVLRPRPGGRMGSTTVAAGARPAPGASSDVRIVGSGLNELVDAATPLFSLAGQLRDVPKHPDPDMLRQQVVQEIQRFDRTARNAGVPQEMVLAARYALCTLIDEIVMNTPWGLAWSQQSALSVFHNETFGGEKFFQILERVSQEPARNLELLEFMYICLALGLEGKYRVLDRGRAQLEQVRDNLYRTIRTQRGDFERELSPRWHGLEARGGRLARFVPLWVVGALAGVVLLGIYLGFTYSLNRASDPVFAEFASIGRGPMTSAVIAGPPSPPQPVERTLTLREALANDIRAGRVEVEEVQGGTQIRIRGDGLFAPGSVEVTREYLPLIRRIGDALGEFPGAVLVTGHTDSTPISLRLKLRFPSNWHLSQERAESVLQILSTELANESRLAAEGRGATEPIASNETPDGRARNRRVEITLLKSGVAS